MVTKLMVIASCRIEDVEVQGGLANGIAIGTVAGGSGIPTLKNPGNLDHQKGE